ncbi:hypothetical protein LXL04_018633 [Taraxacum kok-saghyz]
MAAGEGPVVNGKGEEHVFVVDRAGATDEMFDEPDKKEIEQRSDEKTPIPNFQFVHYFNAFRSFLHSARTETHNTNSFIAIATSDSRHSESDRRQQAVPVHLSPSPATGSAVVLCGCFSFTVHSHRQLHAPFSNLHYFVNVKGNSDFKEDSSKLNNAEFSKQSRVEINLPNENSSTTYWGVVDATQSNTASLNKLRDPSEIRV